MAETMTGCAVGPESINSGKQFEDHDEGDRQDEAGLNAGEQWGATGRYRPDDAGGEQTRYEPECD
jgi:hypothetical protein